MIFHDCCGFDGCLPEKCVVDVMEDYFVMRVMGGRKAMEGLRKLEEYRRCGRTLGPVRKRGIASNEICTFLNINTLSL